MMSKTSYRAWVHDSLTDRKHVMNSSTSSAIFHSKIYILKFCTVILGNLVLNIKLRCPTKITEVHCYLRWWFTFTNHDIYQWVAFFPIQSKATFFAWNGNLKHIITPSMNKYKIKQIFLIQKYWTYFCHVLRKLNTRSIIYLN